MISISLITRTRKLRFDELKPIVQDYPPGVTELGFDFGPDSKAYLLFCLFAELRQGFQPGHLPWTTPAYSPLFPAVVCNRSCPLESLGAI